MEYQRKTDHVGAQAGDQFHDRLGVGGIGLDPAGKAGVPHRRQKVAQTEIVLILKTDQQDRAGGPFRHRDGSLPVRFWARSPSLLPARPAIPSTAHAARSVAPVTA